MTDMGRKRTDGAGARSGRIRDGLRAVPRRQWISAALTANAIQPPSNYWLGAGSMIVGGPTSELAPYLLGATAVDGAVGLARGRGLPSAALAAATAAGQAELIRRALATTRVVDTALDAAIGRSDTVPGPASGLLARLSPIALRTGDVEVIRDVSYLEAAPDGGVPDDPAGRARAAKLCRLDIYRSRSGARPGGGGGPAPILLHVHGGMWMGSDKRYEATPLLLHMAARGWLCVSINYRLCPKDDLTAQIIDVKKAIAWVREHAPEYGGDPEFIAVTGGSAGGHLAALAALSAGDPDLQPGFDHADTSVQAAVPQYGIYDFTAGSGTDHALRRRDKFLAPMILKTGYDDSPDLFAQVSPLLHAHPDAPPFFVLHGTADTGVECAESRFFVDRLRSVSRNPVAYAELPGAQHAYDHLQSLRTRRAVRGIERFLEWSAATAR